VRVLKSNETGANPVGERFLRSRKPSLRIGPVFLSCGVSYLRGDYVVVVAYALTPNTVELIPTLGAPFPRGGPVQDPVLTVVPKSVSGDENASRGRKVFCRAPLLEHGR